MTTFTVADLAELTAKVVKEETSGATDISLCPLCGSPLLVICDVCQDHCEDCCSDLCSVCERGGVSYERQ